MDLFGFHVGAEIVVCALAGFTFLVLILVIVQAATMAGLKKRIASFMEGGDGKSLEAEISERLSEIKGIKEAQERTEEDVKSIYEALRRTYQRSAVLKYDAFQEMGGGLSFVIVMLDESLDGFILNSVHSNRDGCFIYVKSVENGEAIGDLSEEELEALETAKA